MPSATLFACVHSEGAIGLSAALLIFCAEKIRSSEEQEEEGAEEAKAEQEIKQEQRRAFKAVVIP